MARLAVVLVRPARAANVGAAARALKNFAQDDLRLVQGVDCLPGGADHGEARALAWNADDVLGGARRFEALEDAVADLGFVAAATGRVEAGREVLTPREFAEEAARLPRGVRAGCVFGPEDHGLSNRELDACRVSLRIPTSADQPSLNLAQAVVVVSYEVGLATADLEGRGGAAETADDPPATEGELDRLFRVGGDLLLRAGYLNPQAPEHVLGELRRILARARPSGREVGLLLALARQLDWASRHPPE